MGHSHAECRRKQWDVHEGGVLVRISKGYAPPEQDGKTIGPLAKVVDAHAEPGQ